MERTHATKVSEVNREWYVVDATGQTLGRLATQIASILRGKHKPLYVPYLDTGDFVVVINAEKIVATGNKLEDKFYYRHSNYPGGIKSVSLRRMLETHPERVITFAVQGMLPKNRLGRKLIGKLKAYAGAEHPHTAQQPKAFPLQK